MKTSKRTFAIPAFAASMLLAGAAHAGTPAGLELGAEVMPGGTCSADGSVASTDVAIAVIAGSAAPVTFHVSIAGGAFTDAGTSRNWTAHGATKAMEETLAVNLPANGLGAQVWICASQPGANGKGNEGRSACAAVVVPGVLCDTGPGGPT